MMFKNIKFEEDYRHVILNDEKTFNLGKKDGWAAYWQGLRTEQSVLLKRHFEGKHVMVLLMIFY